MTKEKFSNAHIHYAVHPLFKTAFEWIAENANAGLPEGKGKIGETGLTFNCQRYDSHPFDWRKFETHDRYIDIQFIISGTENIFLGEPETMETAVAYDAEKDLRFLAGRGTPVLVSAGEFMLIWPHEAHAPGCDPSAEKCAVHKVIVKVPV